MLILTLSPTQLQQVDFLENRHQKPTCLEGRAKEQVHLSLALQEKDFQARPNQRQHSSDMKSKIRRARVLDNDSINKHKPSVIIVLLKPRQNSQFYPRRCNSKTLFVLGWSLIKKPLSNSIDQFGLTGDKCLRTFFFLASSGANADQITEIGPSNCITKSYPLRFKIGGVGLFIQNISSNQPQPLQFAPVHTHTIRELMANTRLIWPSVQGLSSPALQFWAQQDG